MTNRATVSVLSAALVHGSPREGTVVASTGLGCYVLLDDGSTVLPVLTRDALALPTAVRLGERIGDEPFRFALGRRVLVGGSRIAAPGLSVEIVRTVRPAQVRRAPAGRPHTPLDRGAVLERLGRGPGLTPEGDDEIAGHLLVLAAVGGLVPDLEPDLHRTTALSASLLRAAAQGYAVPVVVAYVDAVVGGDARTERRLRPRVAAIGHTSGPALVRGIHGALDGTAEPSTERMLA